MKVENLLDKLDGSGSDDEFEAIRQLRKLEIDLPFFLLKKYKDSRKWQTRSSCLYHSIRFSRDNDSAVELGVLALSDKSKVVRYRACMLLAYSLDKSALPPLRTLVENAKDSETKANAKAAIDAIESQNSNFFIDREYSGKMVLKIT